MAIMPKSQMSKCHIEQLEQLEDALEENGYGLPKLLNPYAEAGLDIDSTIYLYKNTSSIPVAKIKVDNPCAEVYLDDYEPLPHNKYIEKYKKKYLKKQVQEQEQEQEYKPYNEDLNPYSKVKMTGEQALVQQISLASNGNVDVQSRYIWNQVQTEYRLRCHVCGLTSGLVSETFITNFNSIADGPTTTHGSLIEAISKFCSEHRHPERAARTVFGPVPVTMPYIPTAADVMPDGRKFRKEDEC